MAARKKPRSSPAQRKKTAGKKPVTIRSPKYLRELRELREEAAKMREDIRGLESKREEAEVYGERFADLYNFSPIGCLTLNAQGIVTDLNLAAASILHRGRQALLGSPFALFLDRGSLDSFLEHLRLCKQGEGRVETDLELCPPEGGCIPVRLVTTQLPYRARLNRGIYQAVLIDMSEQKALERTLRDSDERLRMALTCASAGHWSIQLTNREVTWSEEFYQLLGVDPAKVPPSESAFLELLIPSDRNAAKRMLDAVSAGELDHFHGEYRLRHRAGQVRWIGMFGRVVRSARRQAISISGIGIDVTAQKEAEEVLRKSREMLEQTIKKRTADLQAAKAVLEQEIAERKQLEQQILEIGENERRRMGQDLHDGLGQQITGIIFHAHLLEKHLSNKGIKEAEIARQIVSLLNEAKIQARQIARGLQPVDPAPNGLMTGLDHFATTTSELYHIDCRFICPEPVMITEQTTAIHLFRITQEAVANAFRHGGAGKVEIHLRKDDNDGLLELSVTDDGRGLPPARGRHEGLGLRFMKYRAETMGGTFDIRRRPGGGTMVRCRVRNNGRGGET